MSRNPISDEKRAGLKAAFDRGAGPYEAAADVDVTAVTAVRYFRLFGWDGKRRPRPASSRKRSGVPVYDGPDWIG